MGRHKSPYYQKAPRKLVSIPITDEEEQTLRLLATEWRLPGFGYAIARMVREYIDYLRRTAAPESYLLKPQTMPRQHPSANTAAR